MRETLSDRLKRLRLAKGYSVKEVAEKIGVPLTTYREWEHGRNIVGEPYPDLARIFEISVYELITGESSSSLDILKSFDLIDGELKKIKQNLLSK